jgi:hydroxypyruvate reductase
MNPIDPRDFLRRVYRAGVAAADPEIATRQAVQALDDLAQSTWIIAIGKAAHRMASGAADAVRSRHIGVAGGLVIAHEPSRNTSHALPFVQGDHPLPGRGSQLAADYLRDLSDETTSGSDALVLVSGGATSLVGAPIDALAPADLRETFAALLASGADIDLMNAIRKRLLRFGGGRLALALQCRRVHCLIASDVLGNDPASIASGPCVADAGTARDTRDRARAAGIWNQLPESARRHLDAMADGSAADLPPRDHPRFASTSARVILDRTDAERGAAAAAQAMGAAVEILRTPLTSEAAIAGERFARGLLSPTSGTGVIWSGEATVSLGTSRGAGGRCQEFALACAKALDAAGPSAAGITILAAGTDGRDGPTDAAGAIVDATTWATIRAHGIDPASALRDHSSYDALESAGALLMTGPTGTNVNDLVIALQAPSS